MGNIVIIGGANIDYLGKTQNKLIDKDSNVGILEISDGGVARNICENIARLGMPVTFISCIGNDPYGLRLKNNLEDLKVKVLTPTISIPTSAYLAILDETGDMALAISDTRCVEALTFDLIKPYEAIILSAEYLILDTNLSQDLINEIFLNYHHKKIIVDAISTTKVEKIKKHLANIYLLKVNEFEYNVIKSSLKDFSPKILVISHGKEPLIYIENHQTYKVVIPQSDKIVSTTGAGDSMVAGIVSALNKGYKLEDAINFGIKIARITILSEKTVSDKINEKLWGN